MDPYTSLAQKLTCPKDDLDLIVEKDWQAQLNKLMPPELRTTY